MNFELTQGVKNGKLPPIGHSEQRHCSLDALGRLLYPPSKDLFDDKVIRKDRIESRKENTNLSHALQLKNCPDVVALRFHPTGLRPAQVQNHLLILQ